MPLKNHIVNKIKQSKERSLSLSNSGLFDDEVQELVSLIKDNMNIVVLNLQGNNIKNEGAKALAKLKQLISLDLTGNDIGNEGAWALIQNKYITSLNLSRNGSIDDTIGKKILDTTYHHYLNLEGTNISPDFKKKIINKIIRIREEARLPWIKEWDGYYEENLIINKDNNTNVSNNENTFNFLKKREKKEEKTDIEVEDSILWNKLSQETENRLSWAAQALQKNPNDAKAHYILAIHHWYGWEVEPNHQTALIHYDKAANQSHAGACCELARLYLQGYSFIGIDKDFEKAKFYVEQGLKGKDKKEFDTDNYKQQNFIEQLEGFLNVIEALKKMQFSR